ncbi:MAG: D-aminoacyl-tRNA deacylase [Gammaproteobacteria bacterium]|nr:D-aminoacyl-tRNA deacylase [Gammaproteobacteria bacterium]MCZ6911618.1 D-aminoacyl-tRNA deacylase [Pseudomonadota bacterium]
MIGLLQRVSRATVIVDGRTIGKIDRGLLVLVGVEKHDTSRQAEGLAERLLDYRVFADAEQRMNLGLRDVGGGLLLVPQFTLAADTRKGLRASFTGAANPKLGRRLFDELASRARQLHQPVETGEFGADMQVSLVNDGPVTFWLQIRP